MQASGLCWEIGAVCLSPCIVDNSRYFKKRLCLGSSSIILQGVSSNMKALTTYSLLQGTIYFLYMQYQSNGAYLQKKRRRKGLTKCRTWAVFAKAFGNAIFVFLLRAVRFVFTVK